MPLISGKLIKDAIFNFFVGDDEVEITGTHTGNLAVATSQADANTVLDDLVSGGNLSDNDFTTGYPF